MLSADSLVKFGQGGGRLFRQSVPFGILETSGMREDKLVKHVARQRSTIQQFVTPERPRLVLLSPIRAVFGDQFINALLPILFQLRRLDCRRAHVPSSNPACRFY